MDYIMVTDGACSLAKGRGGIGIIFIKDDNIILEYSKMYKNVTNNQMEMLAVIVGLSFIKKPIDSLIIYTDSKYIVGCATLGWKRKKNVKLWEIFDKEYNRVKEICPNIEFKHIRGHQKDDSITTKWNNYVDRLAVTCYQKED